MQGWAFQQTPEWINTFIGLMTSNTVTLHDGGPELALRCMRLQTMSIDYICCLDLHEQSLLLINSTTTTTTTLS